jgi:hypothetical protein
MDDLSQEQLVEVLAKDLVAQLAPQELPLFRATSQAYFQNSDKLFKGQEPKDEMLGFGVGESVTLLTPFILSILVEIVKYLSNEFASTVKMEGASYINDMVKQSFQKFRRQPLQTKAPEEESETASVDPQGTVLSQPARTGAEPAGLDRQEASAPPTLTKEQLTQIYEVALQKARDLKLSESRATLLADSVIGTLALAR